MERLFCRLERVGPAVANAKTALLYGVFCMYTVPALALNGPWPGTMQGSGLMVDFVIA